jgi:hypothetical protein
MDNPNALIVNSSKPGELALIGEAAGKWKIDVETAAHERVSYKVKVPATNSTDRHPGATSDTSPAMASSSKSAADKPVVTAALDSGSGPVVPATSAPDRDGDARGECGCSARRIVACSRADRSRQVGGCVVVDRESFRAGVGTG